MQTNCSTQAILSPTAYQTNIYAPNWITGDQTINDIVNEYVDRSQQFNNITNCPLSNPFYDGTGCINCQDPNPIFNMKTRQCTSCPQGQVIDVNAKVCKKGDQPTPNATNPIAVGNSTGNQTQNPNDVYCPVQTPFFNGQECIQCDSFNPIFNATTGVCTRCPDQTTFNSALRQCVSSKPNTSNVGSNPNFVGPQPQPGPNDIPCPSSTPFFNGEECIRC